MADTIADYIPYNYSITDQATKLIMANKIGEVETSWKPPLPDQFLGIEIEVEKCKNLNTLIETIPDRFYHITQDGSLRNNGLEIITQPIQAKAIQTLLYGIYRNLPATADFSPRTSIHVHINIRNLTHLELLNVIYTYLAVERILYTWVGKNRYKSIFCVPLQDTDLSLNLNDLITKKRFKDLFWFKYTGLNLLPIFKLGTIEFRHLHGTHDPHEILSWISKIQHIFRFALTTSHDNLLERIATLNSSSEYRTFLEDVFGAEAADLWYPMFAKDIERGISYIKNYVFTNEFTRELRDHASRTSTLYKRLNMTQKSKKVIKPANVSEFLNNWVTTPTISINSSPTEPMFWGVTTTTISPTPNFTGDNF